MFFFFQFLATTIPQIILDPWGPCLSFFIFTKQNTERAEAIRRDRFKYCPLDPVALLSERAKHCSAFFPYQPVRLPAHRRAHLFHLRHADAAPDPEWHYNLTLPARPGFIRAVSRLMGPARSYSRAVHGWRVFLVCADKREILKEKK